jgi:hypothetical protein
LPVTRSSSLICTPLVDNVVIRRRVARGNLQQ